MDTGQKPTRPAKLSEKPNPDRRIAKTRNSLALALFTLMPQRDWDDISVQDICDAANVARSSFYAHFESKTALLDLTIARSLERSREARQLHNGTSDLLAWIIDHVTQNRNLFNRVARGSGTQTIMSRFKASLCAELADELRRSGASAPEMQAHFILGGTFDALIAWSRTWKTSQLPMAKADILAMAGCICDRTATPRV
jgi:AcrR family transcriptional regulator